MGFVNTPDLIGLLEDTPKLSNVNGGRFKVFAVHDGRLITGQQQYSGRRVAQMLIEALGV